jgi:hypothetical protein
VQGVREYTERSCDRFHYKGGLSVSIVRVGLAETKDFAEGYEAIFGKQKSTEEKKAPAGKKTKAKKPASKSTARASAKKKPAAKKTTRKSR